MDNYGRTALYLAAMEVNKVMVLEHKADIGARDGFGGTALH
jgi:hypothetical protein